MQGRHWLCFRELMLNLLVFENLPPPDKFGAVSPQTVALRAWRPVGWSRGQSSTQKDME